MSPDHTNRFTSGFTLVEWVVALLVLAVGLLGLASLQAMSLKQQQQLVQSNALADRASNALETLRIRPNLPRDSQIEIAREAQGTVSVQLQPAAADAPPLLLRSRL